MDAYYAMPSHAHFLPSLYDATYPAYQAYPPLPYLHQPWSSVNPYHAHLTTLANTYRQPILPQPPTNTHSPPSQSPKKPELSLSSCRFTETPESSFAPLRFSSDFSRFYYQPITSPADFIDLTTDLRSDNLSLDSLSDNLLLDSSPGVSSLDVLPTGNRSLSDDSGYETPEKTVQHAANQLLSVLNNRKRKYDNQQLETDFAQTSRKLPKREDSNDSVDAIVKQSITRNVAENTNYACAICSKEFTRKANLKMHVQTHVGVKPYSCKFCHKTFTRRSNWKSHEGRHTGDMTYSCSVCSKGFVDWSSWKRHELIHTGEKPHRCDVCGMRFVQLANMRRHQSRHTTSSDCEKDC